MTLGARRAKSDIWWPEAIEIAASGRVVAAAWADGRGRVLARVSSDAGRHWTKAAVIGREGVRTAAAAAGRVAFGGAADGLRWISLWSPEGGWTAVTVPQREPFNHATSSWDLALTIDRQGVLGALIPQCEWEATTNRSEWQTTVDAGRTWSDQVSVSGCMEEPHAVLDPDGHLYVLALGDEGYALTVRPRD